MSCFSNAVIISTNAWSGLDYITQVRTQVSTLPPPPLEIVADASGDLTKPECSEASDHSVETERTSGTSSALFAFSD